MGQAIEPLVYGHSTGLSPFSVIVAAIFWSWVWGPIGLILSTPLTLCLVVLGRHVDRLEFLDVLLGDRPALTPMENFYQRLLAGDPDEVLEEAERPLKQRSLSTYYDEVALKGLQLAAKEAARCADPRAARARGRRSSALVDELADHDDLDPKPSAKDPTTPRRPGPERALPNNPTPARGCRAGTLPPAWRGGRRPVPRRARPAGRGGLGDAGAAPRQARHGRARRALRGGVAGDRAAGRGRGGDGVHLLPRHQGSRRTCAT